MGTAQLCLYCVQLLGHTGSDWLFLTILLGISLGFSLSSVEEEGIRRLYVNSVKETGLAFKKGKILYEWFCYYLFNSDIDHELVEIGALQTY